MVAADTRALRQMIHVAIETASHRRRNEPDAGKVAHYAVRLRLRRPPPQRALIATVMPLSPESKDRLTGPQAHAIIFVVQVDGPLLVDDRAVEAAFDLTPRQANLEMLLARGESLAQAAAALSIAQETARSHLEDIFERTNTRRQPDLVRVLNAAFSSISTFDGSK
jgi:DNA-binding CsgD family transcriptional regulator